MTLKEKYFYRLKLAWLKQIKRAYLNITPADPTDEYITPALQWFDRQYQAIINQLQK